ncbi:helix-turn-helix domain-containing protein [Kribbella sp. NPDC051718]|uniref:helix-turn-helix domain-containing protein n=1 Tax=Kribbella sp. NPDC051718 TaxID=3155168 RepID=UPI003446B989
MDVAAYGESDTAFHFLLEGGFTLEIADKSYPLTAGLLANPALTVAAVATQVGYTSESAFTQTFHQTTGTTPGRFRRTLLS